jgi:hypothetical protein
MGGCGRRGILAGQSLVLGLYQRGNRLIAKCRAGTRRSNLKVQKRSNSSIDIRLGCFGGFQVADNFTLLGHSSKEILLSRGCACGSNCGRSNGSRGG